MEFHHIKVLLSIELINRVPNIASKFGFKLQQSHLFTKQQSHNSLSHEELRLFYYPYRNQFIHKKRELPDTRINFQILVGGGLIFY